MREEKGSISVIDAIISFELSQAGSEKASSLAKIYKEVLSDASGLGEHHKRELAKQFSEHMDMYGNSDAIEEADGFYWKFSPIDSCYLEDKASQSGYEGEASNPAKRLKVGSSDRDGESERETMRIARGMTCLSFDQKHSHNDADRGRCFSTVKCAAIIGDSSERLRKPSYVCEPLSELGGSEWDYEFRECSIQLLSVWTGVP